MLVVDAYTIVDTVCLSAGGGVEIMSLITYTYYDLMLCCVTLVMRAGNFVYFTTHSLLH